MENRTATLLLIVCLVGSTGVQAESPPFTDYCQRLQQEIQGRKHGFLAGNLSYYVGGFHASWDIKEHETIGLTHPFCHDLRSRGVGLVRSEGKGPSNTGLGNDFSGWEFYKDTRVLYGSVLMEGKTYDHPVPSRMYWRPDRMVCEYDLDGVQLREEKFIATNDVACTLITSSKPVRLRFSGQSFFGRHSVQSTAIIRYDADNRAIHIVEGGTTKCLPETDRSERVGPIMYQGMSTVLASSRDFSRSISFSKGDRGQEEYEFSVSCDPEGVALVWAMDDSYDVAIGNAREVLNGSGFSRVPTSEDKTSTLDEQILSVRNAMIEKTDLFNYQLNNEIPWFRCSDQIYEDIYYFLWSLYLMYYIEVGEGWEQEPHTQTAVNNFLGMHRYDATFQIKVGSWTADKSQYAYGNVLTWKHLYTAGHFKVNQRGGIALADNKGTNWHSGVYGNELSEHVIGAWQIYQHTGDVEFVRKCYEGFFREVFRKQISPFASNHFEVAEALLNMARVTNHPEDFQHWQSLVPREPKAIRAWFDQRWQVNGHQSYFAGPRDDMLMTNGFWHMRSKYFPRDYALSMAREWGLNRDQGFYGRFFPTAMSMFSMEKYASKVDHSFGYTPDTAYFTLIGMFQQRLGDIAWKLTLNHLENYNFATEWGIPVAPEAYTRTGERFGDQYSNFNAGKILLFLEGLAGLEYSLPNQLLTVHDTMPEDWKWMEFRIPLRMRDQRETRWPHVRFVREHGQNSIVKTITVSDCPLPVRIEPWTEERVVMRDVTSPVDAKRLEDSYPNYYRYEFTNPESVVSARIELNQEKGLRE